MRVHFYTLFALTIFLLSSACCVFVGFFVYQFPTYQEFSILPVNPILFPLDFEWTNFYRFSFLLRLFFLQLYVFLFSLIILFLSLKRYLPGMFYLLLFLFGWLFEAPKAMLLIYGDDIFLTEMIWITYLSCFGQFLRMSALLFFTLHDAGLIKKYSLKWQASLFIVFLVIFSFLQVDVTYIFPTGLLNLANAGLVTGFTIICFIFTVLVRFFMMINPKLHRSDIRNFFATIIVFVVSNILFLRWGIWELFIGLTVLYILTGRLLYDICRQYRWFLD